MILEEKNALEIDKIIKNKVSDFRISTTHINEILHDARLIIPHYYKDKYILEEISEEGKNEYFAGYESNFINIDNKNLWVIGAINTYSKKLRLELLFIRDSNTLKKFIYTHIKPRNCIVSDLWDGYMWLGTDGIYHHSVRKFGHSDFGYGYESTSHIESVCGNLKNIIKRIYYPIPNNNFVLFLKEAEFRREISGFANNIKWQNFVDIMNYISNIDI